MDILGNAQLFLVSLGAGLIPSLFWLWFWLREDEERPEPKILLFMTFMLGMIAVIPVIKFQQWTLFISDQTVRTFVWAGIEEIMKFAAVFALAWHSTELNDPIDFAVYFICAALGFAALENAFYIFSPINSPFSTTSLFTNSLRYLGATLLHAISSAVVGIFLGLYFRSQSFKKLGILIIGLLTATLLHSLFNLLIINSSHGIFFTFILLWLITIIILFIFERLRQISHNNDNL